MLSTVSGLSRKDSNSPRRAWKTASAEPNRSSSLVAALGPTPGVIFNAIQSITVHFSLSTVHSFGGGVWESNPPKYALAHSLTVLKTVPITGQDAPPLKSEIS